jgi:hypothetical protein
MARLEDALLNKAIHAFRMGENTMGATAFEAYMEHREVQSDDYMMEIGDAFRRSDFLCVADILEYKMSVV